MNGYLADSSSVLDHDEIYPQHQAAITLILEHLTPIHVVEFNWLDLLCGQGQILVHFDEHFSTGSRSKLTYFAYDINIESVTSACARANKLQLKGVIEKSGHIQDFRTLLDGHAFDFITISSGFHELNPFTIPRTLLDCLQMLRTGGTLYLYDVEKLANPELGAICFSKPEIERILHSMISVLGIKGYKPDVARWPRKNGLSWSTTLKREYFGSHAFSKAIIKRVIKAGEKTIRELLQDRALQCTNILDAVKNGTMETHSDQATKNALLYDFFALRRCLEVNK